MNKINMGIIQGHATSMTKDELIKYAKSLKLNDSQKLRLWNHWQTVQAIKKVNE